MTHVTSRTTFGSRSSGVATISSFVLGLYGVGFLFQVASQYVV